MKTKVTMLKWSEWAAKQWDGQSPIPTLVPNNDNMYQVTVDAETHQEAFRKAFQHRFGTAPPEDRVQMLTNYRITKGEVSFYVLDDYLPTTGLPAHPQESEIVRE